MTTRNEALQALANIMDSFESDSENGVRWLNETWMNNFRMNCPQLYDAISEITDVLEKAGFDDY